MSLSYFYIEQYDATQIEIELDEDTSYHIVQVLRMKKGERLNLTDGKGNLTTAAIHDCHKKHCVVLVERSVHEPQAGRKVSIGISLIKNASRFEWFLEKVTEIGINEIIPLVCERTIKERFRFDRMKGICISAMLQSQQTWLPVLHEPVAFELLFREEEFIQAAQRFIAHCTENEKRSIVDVIDRTAQSQIILIGPEGDFSEKELEMARQMNCIPVSLGDTRLRAETAGVVAAALMR